MKLITKLVLFVSISAILATTLSIVAQKRVIDRVQIERTRDAMRSTLIQAETVRENGTALLDEKAFDFEELKAELKEVDDYRDATIYKTIPVVAAWDSIAKVSEEYGYDFRVSKHGARNPENNPTAQEAKILAELEAGGAEEYFLDDEESDQLVYARPIVLSADCLYCHGDPATSPTGDGRDILGFEMEGWKAGEMHGAFILKADKKALRAESTAALGEGISSSILFIIPVVGFFLVGIYFLLKKTVVGPMAETFGSINAACSDSERLSREFSRSGSELADGVGEQVSSIEETSATLVQLSGMTERNAQKASQAQGHVKRAGEVVKRGVERASEMETAIDAIHQSSADISVIIKTIDEIAFQTNILALNAAVEAARAGQAGSGFAVVADEVRSLAQKSARAAQESSEMIAKSIGKSEAGVESVKQFVTHLRSITTEMTELDATISEISEASSQQNEGISQISQAMHRIDEVAQRAASSSQGLANAAGSLDDQSQSTKRLVERLESMIYGRGSSERPALPEASAKRRQPPVNRTTRRDALSEEELTLWRS